MHGYCDSATADLIRKDLFSPVMYTLENNGLPGRTDDAINHARIYSYVHV
jgi:hypothetical protein